MACLPRLDLSGPREQAVQHGNNRLPCFLDNTDWQRYLHILHGDLLDTGVALHAYVLMSSHAPLLLTPPRLGAMSCLMQLPGRRYVREFKARHERAGALWEGRYRSFLMNSERYLLRCSQYTDPDPVRTRMTDDPAKSPDPAVRHCVAGETMRFCQNIRPTSPWADRGRNAQRRTGRCWPSPCRTTSCKPSAAICNNAHREEIASVRWSGRKLAASPAYAPLIVFRQPMAQL